MATLAERIAEEGPLPTREAVRLIARLARAIEILHAAGAQHGRISPEAIVIGGRLLASARLLRPSVAPEVPAFWSPERSSLDGPSREDDAFAVAHLLFHVLTGQRLSVGERAPPLAVFDAGDDTLEDLLSSALSREPAARPRDLTAFRAELDRWLELEGATIEEGLSFDDEELEKKALDLSSLPPPPQASRSGPPPLPAGNKGRGLGVPGLFAVVDEETTHPREEGADEERKTLPTPEPKPKREKPARREPKLVPPRISTRPPSLAPPRETPVDEPSSSSGAPERASASQPPRPKSSAKLLVALGAGLALAAYFGRELVAGDDAPAPPSGASAPVEPTPEAAAASTPAAATSTAPLGAASAPPASPAPTASAAPSAAPAPAALDASRCVASAFSADTFEGTFTDLSSVCGETEIVAGASRLHETVVRAGMGRPVTGGMKDWALLGYYELPAFALIRKTCCPSAAPLSIPSSPDTCPRSMESAITAVADAGGDEKALGAGVDAMEKAVRCAFRAKAQTRFGKHPKPSGGEGTALRGFAKRLAGRKP